MGRRGDDRRRGGRPHRAVPDGELRAISRHLRPGRGELALRRHGETVSRLPGGDRRGAPRARPPRGHAGHRGAGGETPARFEPVPRTDPGAPRGAPLPRDDGGQGLLLQQRHGGERGRDQARPEGVLRPTGPRAPRDRRAGGVVPRPDVRRALRHRPAEIPPGIRADASGVHRRSLRRHRRPGGGPDRQGLRLLLRTGPGGERRPDAPAGVPEGGGGTLPPEGRTARGGRNPDGDGANGGVSRVPSLRCDSRHRHPGEGIGERTASGSRRGERGSGGGLRTRDPRQHLRRESRLLRRGAGGTGRRDGPRVLRGSGTQGGAVPGGPAGDRRPEVRRAGHPGHGADDRDGAGGGDETGRGEVPRCRARGERRGGKRPSVPPPADRPRRRDRPRPGGPIDGPPRRRENRLKKDLLRILDLSAREILSVIAAGAAWKRRGGRKGAPRPLAGKTLAMIFQKASTRTRVSFEVGMTRLGGHALFMSPEDTQIGRGEPIRDTARVLSRYADAVMIRTFAHAAAVELAESSTVPVINGLTDAHHPCQVLADLLTAKERGVDLRKMRVAFIGDGNNVANSWVDAAHVLGFALRVACPEGYEPDAAIRKDAEAAGRGDVCIVRDPAEAARGADVLYTDVWTSMGQEAERRKRLAAFRGYCVDAALLRLAAPHAIVMHCLPAHRGEEITDEVIEGPQSAVFDEAENRLHVQMAVLEKLIRH